jgi:hypothetical protein
MNLFDIQKNGLADTIGLWMRSRIQITYTFTTGFMSRLHTFRQKLRAAGELAVFGAIKRAVDGVRMPTSRWAAMPRPCWPSATE